MLTISHRTFGALDAAQEQRFLTWLIGVLEEEFPEEARALGSKGVAALVCRTYAQAKSLGISDEEVLGQLCAMAVGFGEDVLQDPQIASYLRAGGDMASRIRSLMDEIDAIG